MDLQVKVRGYRIETGEIEAALVEHPSVRQAVVLARDDMPGDKQRVAYVVADRADGRLADQLRTTLSAFFPEYMVPSSYMTLDTLPLTANGKINRLALPIPDLANSEVASLSEASTLTEAVLARIWGESLNRARVDVEQDFFALGGSSLLAMTIVLRVEHELGVKLPIRQVLAGRTLRQIAGSLTPPSTPSPVPAESGRSRFADNDARTAGVICLRPDDATALFLIYDGLGQILLNRNLAIRLPAGIAVYGIEPASLPGIHVAFSSFEDMAADYAAQIRAVQRKGPYLLGGTCAGGAIAYATAVCLTQIHGEKVQLVAMLDSTSPHAIRLPKNRLSRLETVLTAVSQLQPSLMRRWREIAVTLARKAINAAVYDVTEPVDMVFTAMRFRLLLRLLAKRAVWPRLVPELNFQQIGFQLEGNYEPPVLPDVPVLLVRPTTGSGDPTDQPSRELYACDTLGWVTLANHLEVVDVKGGHSSMLHEQHVEPLVAVLSPRLVKYTGGLSERGATTTSV